MDSMNVRLEVPGAVYDSTIIEWASETGYGGCEGAVFPALMQYNGSQIRVQVKRFYKDTYDDKGINFTQDPEKKAEESYEAFQELKSLGFKVVPFFALATTTSGSRYLVMTDLTEGGKEVYDEKEMHRKKVVREKLQAAPNRAAIELELLRTVMLQEQYCIGLGFGVSRMFTRDPLTGEMEAYVTDVGEYGRGVRKSRLTAIIPESSFERSCPENILAAMTEEEMAKDIFAEYRESNPADVDFMDLFHRAYVGVTFSDDLGGWWKEPEWARKVYSRNSFSDKFMKIKLRFDDHCDIYRNINGRRLFETGLQARNAFRSALKRGEHTLTGVPIAYHAAIDSDLFYLQQTEKGGQCKRVPAVVNHVPRFRFFDHGKNRFLIDLQCNKPFGDVAASVNIELDRETSCRMMQGLPRLDDVQFSRRQIKGLTINGKRVRNFDWRRIKEHNALGGKYYSYNDIYFHRSFNEKSQATNSP